MSISGAYGDPEKFLGKWVLPCQRRRDGDITCGRVPFKIVSVEPSKLIFKDGGGVAVEPKKIVFEKWNETKQITSLQRELDLDFVREVKGNENGKAWLENRCNNDEKCLETTQNIFLRCLKPSKDASFKVDERNVRRSLGKLTDKSDECKRHVEALLQMNNKIFPQ